MRWFARHARRRVVNVLLTALVLLTARVAAAQIPTPDSQCGFHVGDDGRLAAAEQIEAYFQLVAARSDRVKIVEIGPTTRGRRTIAAIVSAPENIRNLDGIRETNQRLADSRTLSPDDARLIAGTHPV